MNILKQHFSTALYMQISKKERKKRRLLLIQRLPSKLFDFG